MRKNSHALRVKKHKNSLPERWYLLWRYLKLPVHDPVQPAQGEPIIVCVGIRQDDL